MKTNLEQTIKNQLAEREIDLPENSWGRMVSMLDENNHSQNRNKFQKFRIISVAASVVLLLGIGFLFLTKQNPQDFNKGSQAQIAFHQKDKNQIIQINKVETTELVKNQKSQNEPQKTVQQKEIKIQKQPEIQSVLHEGWVQNEEVQREIKSVENEKQILIPQESLEITKTETVEPKKETKKSYVDPDMLLYSVENNQAIHESQSNSRLVLIDFNK